MAQSNLLTQKIGLHRTLAEKLTTIYSQKNHDYGDSFGETFRKLGPISAITRMSDKFNRLCSLITLPDEERKVKDESIEDTLMDLANYAIMTLLEMQMKKNEATHDTSGSISSISYDDETALTPTTTTTTITTNTTNTPKKKHEVEMAVNNGQTADPVTVITTRLEKIIKAENIVLYFNSTEQLYDLMQYFNELKNIKIDNTVSHPLTISSLTIGNSLASITCLNMPQHGYVVVYKSVVPRQDYHLGYCESPHDIEGSFGVISCSELFNLTSSNFDQEGNYRFTQKI